MSYSWPRVGIVERKLTAYRLLSHAKSGGAFAYTYAEQAPTMRSSRDEEVFLRHWMYKEIHYGEGQDTAKRLQVQHQAVPADLALLIAATMPDPADQESAGLGPPPAWPWPGDKLRVRLADARTSLARVDGDAGRLSELGPGDVIRPTGPSACR